MSRFEDIDTLEIQEALVRKLKNQGATRTDKFKTDGKRNKNITKSVNPLRTLDSKKKKIKDKQFSGGKEKKRSSIKSTHGSSKTTETVISDHDQHVINNRNESEDEFTDETSESESDPNEECFKEKRHENKYIEMLKNELSLTDYDFIEFKKSRNKDKKEEKTIITAAGKRKREPEIIVFEDPAKRKEKSHSEYGTVMKRLEAEGDSKQDDETFNMRHAKFDVHQFAIRGLAKKDKESAQIAHAIKLGAKPKKGVYVNYKQLLESKREQKEMERQKISMERNMGYKSSSVFSKTAVSGKKRKRQNNTLTQDGQIGKFKEGIQFVSHKQIETVKRNKISRR